MEETDWESRVDNVKRDDIWMSAVKEWLDGFKSEETPIEKRITDYQIGGWSPQYNNEDRIKVTFYLYVVPVDKNNTEWELPERGMGFIDMVKEDGEYKVKYLSEYPEGYDKFLEEFEKWKEQNAHTETIVVPSETRNLKASQEQEINKLSTEIVAVCIGLLVVIGVLSVIKIIKLRNRK